MAHVLLLVTDLEIGGTPTIVREVSTRLHATAAKVTVVCLGRFGPVAKQIRDGGVDVIAFDATIASLPRCVLRLRRLIRERAIDTVLSFLMHANVVASLATRGLGVRALQSIQTTQPWPRWHWTLQKLAAKSAEAIVVPSQAIVDFASKRCGIARERFHIIPNGIDFAAFPLREVFTQQPIRLGFLGRLDPVKRVSIAIAATRAVRFDGLDSELHIFGDGAEKDLAKAAADDPLSGVRWHGLADSPAAALAAMDVLLLPSIGEGFGLVVLEAMASGVPVICSAAGALPELITDGETGLLVPMAGDEAAGFAMAVRRLASDAPLRERMIATARSRAAAFDWARVMPKYVSLLQVPSTSVSSST